jgi:hypothetical protein
VIMINSMTVKRKIMSVAPIGTSGSSPPPNKFIEGQDRQGPPSNQGCVPPIIRITVCVPSNVKIEPLRLLTSLVEGNEIGKVPPPPHIFTRPPQSLIRCYAPE